MSLLVFKPKRGFLEAETMGDKFKTGEAPEAVTKTEEDSELLTQEPKEEVVDEYVEPFC